jgi:hypothetical protein
MARRRVPISGKALIMSWSKTETGTFAQADAVWTSEIAVEIGAATVGKHALLFPRFAAPHRYLDVRSPD